MSIRNYIKKAAESLAFLLLFSYALSFGARHFWFFDILRQFVHQYFIGATILAGALFILRSRKYAVAMVFIASFTAAEIIMATHAPAHTQTSERTIKVAHYNKLYFADNLDRLLPWIKQEAPDIMVIQEADPQALKAIKELATYPHILERIPDNPFGFILLSKYPIISHTITEIPAYVFNNIYVHAIIDIPDFAPLSVYAVHPVPPVSGIHSKQRNSDIKTISDLIKHDKHENIILSGDFNITPYSPYFLDMLRQTELKNEYTSIFPPPTWPSQFFNTIFQIPIDHILHKGSLKLIEKRRSGAMDSDHHSLVAIFSYK